MLGMDSGDGSRCQTYGKRTKQRHWKTVFFEVKDIEKVKERLRSEETGVKRSTLSREKD